MSNTETRAHALRLIVRDIRVAQATHDELGSPESEAELKARHEILITYSEGHHA